MFDQKDSYKLFTQRIIGFAALLGGPVAAGLMLFHNFSKIQRGNAASIVIILSVVFTIVGMSLVWIYYPQTPDQLITLVFGLVLVSIAAFIIAEILQGKIITYHKNNNGMVFSIKNAVTIGGICGLVTFSFITGGYNLHSYLFAFNNEKYHKVLDQIRQNEIQALQLYEKYPQNSSEKEIINFIDNTGMPLLIENISLVKQLDQMDKLPKGYKKQNRFLREYYQLRVKSYKLIRKASKEQTIVYNDQIKNINRRIRNKVKQMKEKKLK